jgi:2,4-dienoyl-CoA reductase-like NADH-dependent reductase (Old Yellow Enzyme family)
LQLWWELVQTEDRTRHRWKDSPRIPGIGPHTTVSEIVGSIFYLQVPFAEAMKKAHPSLVVGAVGTIDDPVVAESYLQDGKADVVSLARGFLRDPHWVLRAAQTLGCTVKAANQYERAWH